MRYIITCIALLVSIPVIGSEFVCEVSGHQFGQWVGDKKMFYTSEDGDGHGYYKYRLITDKDPKIAYFDEDNNKWMWDKLSSVKTKKGAIFYGALAKGGFLTVALSEDESVMVINRINRKGSIVYKEKTYISSGSEFAECVKL